MIRDPRFDDIRPYYEEEVSAALHRIASSEVFPLMATYLYPNRDIEQVRRHICEMGSTDVGDVSWVIPTVTANVNCYSYGAGGHSWQWVAQGKTSYAMKGMIQAGRIMAETARELILHPEVLEEAWKEQHRRLEGESYQCLIPPEVKPHSFEK